MSKTLLPSRTVSNINHEQIEKPASALIFPKLTVGSVKYCPPPDESASELS
jgi:hypothetical protein